jgi:hypothetical protein
MLAFWTVRGSTRVGRLINLAHLLTRWLGAGTHLYGGAANLGSSGAFRAKKGV